MTTDLNELMQQNTSKFSFNQISGFPTDDYKLTSKIKIEPAVTIDFVANFIHVPIQIDSDCVDCLPRLRI